MSKIAEKKALEVYPPENGTLYQRLGYIKGYDQAIQDLLKDANQYMYLSDEIGYAYACGCRKTMQDFLEKAEKWLEIHMPFGEVSHESVYDCIQDFKNYMQD